MVGVDVWVVEVYASERYEPRLELHVYMRTLEYMRKMITFMHVQIHTHVQDHRCTHTHTHDDV